MEIGILAAIPGDPNAVSFLGWYVALSLIYLLQARQRDGGVAA